MSVNQSDQRPCPVCGAQVNPGDRFCPSCGTPQQWPEPQPARPAEPGEPAPEPDPWLMDTRPTPTVPPTPPPYQASAGTHDYQQPSWAAPPQPPRSNSRTWWILGGIFLFFIVVCCCCALAVFVTASQDTALREDLEGTASLLLAFKPAR